MTVMYLTLSSCTKTSEGTRGHSLKLFIERARTNVRKEASHLELPDYGMIYRK